MVCSLIIGNIGFRFVVLFIFVGIVLLIVKMFLIILRIIDSSDKLGFLLYVNWFWNNFIMFWIFWSGKNCFFLLWNFVIFNVKFLFFKENVNLIDMVNIYENINLR